MCGTFLTPDFSAFEYNYAQHFNILLLFFSLRTPTYRNTAVNWFHPPRKNHTSVTQMVSYCEKKVKEKTLSVSRQLTIPIHPAYRPILTKTKSPEGKAHIFFTIVSLSFPGITHFSLSPKPNHGHVRATVSRTQAVWCIRDYFYRANNFQSIP